MYILVLHFSLFGLRIVSDLGSLHGSLPGRTSRSKIFFIGVPGLDVIMSSYIVYLCLWSLSPRKILKNPTSG